MAQTSITKRIPKKKGRPESLSDKTSRVFSYIIFIFLAIIAIYPLLWVATNSFKTDIQLYDSSWALPTEWHFDNYFTAWKYGIANYILNSVIVTSVSVAINIVISLMASYALSRFHFRGRSFLLYFILGGIMLAPEVSLIPLFRILASVHLYDTYWAMILPNVAFGIPFTTFLVRSYMLGLPKDYEEAAVIDGASKISVFWHIVIPLCRPIIASAMLLDAMRVWNEFMFALTFVTKESLKTIPIGLMAFSGALREQWTVVMAGLIISALPMILLFLLTQRHFIRGLASGGIKG